MDCRGHLNLRRHGRGEAALVEARGAEFRILVSICRLDYLFGVFGKFDEAFLVDEVDTLVDEDVCVVLFGFSLREEDLLHRGVSLEPVHLRFVVFMFAAKCLMGEVFNVEGLNNCVVESVPVFLAVSILPITDEGVVMAVVGHTVMNYHAFQLVLVVFGWDGSVEHYQLVLVQIFLPPIVFLHLF